MRSPIAHRGLTFGLLAAAGASLAGCGALANPHADNTVVVTQLNLASCQSVATPPATGWINCGGAVALYETMTITSGFVSVHMVYPEAGSVYSGEQAVDRPQPGDMVVQLNNPHLTKCVADYPTTIDVYDGRENDPNARLLKKISFTIKNSC